MVLYPTSVQTAPLVESGSKPFFFYDETTRRASDTSGLDKKMDLTDVK